MAWHSTGYVTNFIRISTLWRAVNVDISNRNDFCWYKLCLLILVSPANLFTLCIHCFYWAFLEFSFALLVLRHIYGPEMSSPSRITTFDQVAECTEEELRHIPPEQLLNISIISFLLQTNFSYDFNKNVSSNEFWKNSIALTINN